MLKLIQITDCHLGDDEKSLMRGVAPLQTLNHVLEKVIAEKPDFIIGSGDLSENGSIASYIMLQQALNSSRIPYFLIPGNHDLIPHLTEIFQKEALINRKITLKTWDFLFLNTMIEGVPHGYLSPDTLQFLEAALAECDKHVGIFLHHNPILVHNRFVDPYGIQNADAFCEVAERYHDRVKFVSFGHVHAEFHEKHNHIDYYATPSTMVQFREGLETLEFDPTPGYRIFHLDEKGQVETIVKMLRANRS